MLQKQLKRWALHGRTRKPAVVVVAPDQPPALARLAPDECLGRFALDVQRVELLLESFLGRFAGVNRAAPNRFSGFHAWAPPLPLGARRSAAPTIACR